MTFSFFLSIYSRCGAPASWAARHTIVCLDLYECYLCFVVPLCIFMAMVQCYVVDICISVCLFGVVAYALWLCGKCYCG